MTYLNWTTNINSSHDFSSGSATGFVLSNPNSTLSGGVWNTRSTEGTGNSRVNCYDDKPNIAGFSLDNSSSVQWINQISCSTNDKNCGISTYADYIYTFIKSTDYNLMIDNKESELSLVSSDFINKMFDINCGSTNYIIKYDTSGKIIWIVKILGVNDVIENYNNRIIANSSGIFIISQSTENTIFFQDENNYRQFSHDGNFIAKYDHFGNLQWVNKLSKASINNISICANSKDVFISGSFDQKTVEFYDSENREIVNSISHFGDNLNGFIVKYNSSGVYQWSRQISDITKLTNITCNEENITISIQSNAKNGIICDTNNNKENTTLSINNKLDAFILLYTIDGNLQWTTRITGEDNNDYSIILSINESNIYATGQFNCSRLIFDDESSLSKIGENTNSFIIKYDIKGHVEWKMRFGDNETNLLFNNIKNYSGDIYVTGTYDGDNLILYNSTDTVFEKSIRKNDNDGNKNSLLIKINNSGIIQWCARNNTKGNDIQTTINVNSTGIYSFGHFTDDVLVYNSNGELYDTLKPNKNNIIAIVKYNLGSSLIPLFIDGVTNIYPARYNLTKSSSGPYTNVSGAIFYRFVFNNETSSWTCETFNTLNQAMGFIVPICYAGSSIALIKDFNTHEIKNIMIKDIDINQHLIYSYIVNDFVEIKYNVISGYVTNFILIKKNSLGLNYPSNDLYITGNHPIIYNNKEILAQDIKQGIKIKTPPQYIYSLVTLNREPIYINNLQVMSWGYDDFLFKHKQKHNGKWIINNFDSIV